MDRNYQLDDILEEIKRKKAGRGAPSSPASPLPPTPQQVHRTEAPKAPQQPISSRAEFKNQQSIWDDLNIKVPSIQEEPKTQASENHSQVNLNFDSIPVNEPAPQPEREAEKPHRQAGMSTKWKAFAEDSFENGTGGGPFGVKMQTAEDEAADLSWQPEKSKSTSDEMQSTRMDLPVYNERAEKNSSTRVMEHTKKETDFQISYSTEEEPYQLEKNELLEYARPSDAKDVYDELSSTAMWLKIRTIISFAALAVLVYFAFAYSNVKMPLLDFMVPEKHPAVFFGVSLGILGVCALFSANTIGGGLISLFTMKANNDSLAAIAVLACIVQGAALTIVPEQYKNPAFQLYLPVGALILMFNNIGKIRIIQRVGKNFNFVAKAPQQAAVLTVGNKDLLRELTRGLNLEAPKVAYSAKAGLLSNFLQLSYSEDFSEQVTKILAPVCFISAIITSIVAYFFNGDLFIALTVFTAALCITSPLSAVFAAGQPLLVASKRLSKHKCMLSGYAAAERLAETNSVILTASQLFPEGSITLSGMKVFEQNRIDDAILDAASVVCSCDSTLTGVFHDMIEGRISMLKEIDSLTYEDGLGISAWVQGKRVLIGNRDLMANHGIDIPSRDFENRYVQSGGNGIIYLANSGVLTAMYVVTYTCAKEVSRMLSSLEDRGISISLRSNDPNLTPKKIEEIFDYPSDMVTIIPAKLHNQLDKMTVQKNEAKAFAAFVDSKHGLVDCIIAAKGCHSAVNAGVILQLVGVIAGFGLVCFLSFMQSTSQLSWIILSLYQLLWATAVIILPNLRRY